MRVIAAWICTLLLAGCTGKDGESSPTDTDTDTPGTTDTAPPLRDQDGDGVYEDVDCNDLDPAVYPGAVEVCDHRDNDCNRNVDEGLAVSIWYADADADGFGDPAQVTEDCAQPEGHVATAGDCDDSDMRFNPSADENDCTDPNDYNCDGSVGYADADADGWPACRECDDDAIAVNPGSAEVCDGIDNNCDGVVDTDALDARPWYVDADGDGFGDDTTVVVACEGPEGAVLYGGDCDDGDPAYNPGAVESDCTDPNDYNCDGSSGYEDRDGDGYAACDAAECDDGDAAVNGAATERCDTIDNDCDTLVDEADAEDATTWYADVDADGFGDAALELAACEQPIGFVASDTDCDDADGRYNPGAEEACSDSEDYNCDGSIGYADADADGYAACLECDDGDPLVNPAAVEVCNAVDDNCDGVVDADAGDRPTWYYDADGDGYGDPDTAYVACVSPIAFVSLGGDCDDTDSAYNPAATEDDCTDANDYNCDGSTGYADGDGDGYAACLDCADDDAERHPGAEEACNGEDDDCDGTIDVGAVDATAFYVDGDGDGYGSTDVAATACTQPEGTATVTGDCDDTDETFNPAADEGDCTDPNDYNCDGSTGYADLDGDGYAACDPDECDDRNADVYAGATEYCNGIDDNCNGVTDGDASVDRSTWYADADGDGYGDATRPLEACNLPPGYAAISGDCNDLSARYNPGAEESDCADPNDYNCDGLTGYADGDGDGYAACEDCDDGDADVRPGATEYCNGIDDNCNGTVDGALSVDRALWYADADADGYGSSATTTLGCSAPVGYTADDTDCDDGDGAVYPGATEYCDGLDDDCDTVADNGAADAATWYADTDTDGYGGTASTAACTQPSGYQATSTDCNDASSAVSPAATESCNSIDDDCDGATDESGSSGSTTWYLDADGDGYGLATSTISSCAVPSGYVGNDDDCNDASASISPAATESCNSVDDDCDSSVDEGAIGTTWYADGDSDGYGNPASTTVRCTVPSGHVANDDDCDDANSAISPADVEACNGYDDDCDGLSDEAGATGETTWYADADSDGYAGSDTTISACAAPSGYYASPTDCDDAEPLANPGEAEVCNDFIDNDCDGTDNGCAWSGANVVSDASLAVLGEGGDDYLGSSLAGGDLNDDGISDVAVGAYGWDTSKTHDEGIVYLWYGALGADTTASANVTLVGAGHDDAFGTGALVLADPVDGYPDLAIGANAENTNATANGAVYVFSGPITTSGDAGDATAGIYGSNANDAVGTVLGAGDFDGDGQTDLYLGVPSLDATTGNDAGAVAVFYGPLTGTLDLDTDNDVLLYGVDGGDAAGCAVAGGVDVNGDGDEDLLVGAYSNDDAATNAGAVYVVYGPVAADVDLGAADVTVTGSSESQFGYALASLGDTDADGYPELAVGADKDDAGASDAGAVYVFAGADLATATTNSDAAARQVGVTAADYVGRAVAAPGDVDGDGVPDLLFSATGFDNGATSGVGAVYLQYGPFAGSVTLSTYDMRVRGSAASDAVGYAIAGLGDTDDDGFDDFGIGATAVDDGADTSVGAWWLFLGAGL